MNPLSKTLIPFLKKTLDAYSIRHQAIAENIANVDTPGYKPLKVSFEENLQTLLEGRRPRAQKRNPRHLDVGKSFVNVSSLDDLHRQTRDLNLEDEMAELAKNQIRFEFAAKRLAGGYEFLRSSILGRIR
ncbi:MAG: flagellar basal body rod protein FlgB [bacterium]